MATAGFDRNFALITLATFGFWFTVTVHIPMMPMYLATFDLTTAQIGGIYGSAALFAICGRLIAVARVDTSGQRGLLAIGAGLWLVTALIPPLTSHLGMVTLSWWVKGFGLGLFATAASAWVARYLAEEIRGRGLSWWSATNPAATALAAPAAVWTITTYGYLAAFALSAIAAAVSMLATLAPSAPVGDAGASGPPRVLTAALAPGLVGLVLAVTTTGFMVFVPLQLSTSEMAGVAGWPLTFFSAGSLLVRFISGPATDKLSAVPTAQTGALVTTVGILGIGWHSGPGLLMVASLLVGTGVGALSPALAAWTAERASANTRGAATGTYFLFYEIGLIAGGIAFGAAIDILSNAAYFVCGGLLLATALLVVRNRAPGRATPRLQAHRPTGCS